MSEHNDNDRNFPVTDRKTEMGLLLNNILTAIMVMLMGWVGFSINELKEGLAVQSTLIAVSKANMDFVQTAISDVRDNCRNVDKEIALLKSRILILETKK